MLDLDLWQYNAYCEGYKLKCADDLSNMLTASYYNAYWNGASKSKKSLENVLTKLYRELDKDAPREKIDVDAVRKDFERMEALRRNGWWQE